MQMHVKQLTHPFLAVDVLEQAMPAGLAVTADASAPAASCVHTEITLLSYMQIITGSLLAQWRGGCCASVLVVKAASARHTVPV
jgi:hypothetical protein